MHMNIGLEASGARARVAPAGAEAAVTSGPSPGGSPPHTIPVTVVSGASSIQVLLSECSPCHSWNLFSSRLEGS